MHFTILDPNVSTTMNGFLIIANIINLLYNVPQIVTTYKRKSTKDFSGWFLFLRFISSLRSGLSLDFYPFPFVG